MDAMLLIAAAMAVTNSVTELPVITVEASRLGQTKQEIASHVEVIDRAAIEASGAQSTVELLEKRANLNFQKINANPVRASVSMRGYGANGFARVKIIVDGEELNSPDIFTQQLVSVPVGSIERVEILHGPQTLLHGGDASAGVINIITGGDSYEPHTSLEVRGGSWGTVGASAGTRGGFEDLGLTYYGNFDWTHSDGYRDNGWYDLWALKAGMKQRFENESWYAVKAFYSDSRYGLPGGIMTGRASYGVDYGDWRNDPESASDNESKAHDSIYGFSASAEGVVDDENRVDASFGFRRRRSKSYGYLDYDVYTFDWKLKYLNDTRIGGFDNQAALGTDLKLDLIDAYAYNQKTLSGADNDYSRFSGAIFARDEFFLLEELSLFGGARGEWFSSRNRSDPHTGITVSDHGTEGAVGGDVGVNWRPVEDLKVFARWTPFYHAPLADEMFSSYGIANLELKPERGHTTEAGVDWTFLEECNFSFTAYHTELSDEICYYNYGNRNLDDDTRRDGLETSIGWSREKCGSVGILYSLTRSVFAEGENDGKRVPLVPNQQLRVFGEVFIVDWLAVNGGYRFVGEQRYGGDFAGEGGMMPDYGIFDIGVRVMPTWRWLEGFTLAFSCDNLFDKCYSDYGEYFDPWYVYPAAGRSFMVTLRYEF